MNTMREEFEAWRLKKYPRQPIGPVRECGTYWRTGVQRDWGTWQTAFAAGAIAAVSGSVFVNVGDSESEYIRHEDEQAARQPVTMDDALAAGDGTLHGAIDHWQERALRAEAELAGREPVGEAVAWQVKDEDSDWEWAWADKGVYLMVKRHRPHHARELFTTPPQQPERVDGYVLVQIADAKALCAYVTHSPRSALAARRVEALIDNQQESKP